jgi:2-dehydro-3-deoxyphosphogluconate aldolase/(4S)-4-hydroxy-2-oxoglutarate aldolase
MGHVATELPSLGPNRVIATLPDFDSETLLPACEVMCQEGFTAWSLPVGRLDALAEILSPFRRRARIGVHGVTTPAQVRRAAEAGAVFAASPYLLPTLVKAVPGFPVILGGLTPTELRAGLTAGAAAVQLFPAEAFGTSLSRSLPRLLGYPNLIASGRLESYQVRMWLEAGALGAWPHELFGDELVLADNLDRLRNRLQEWRAE